MKRPGNVTVVFDGSILGAGPITGVAGSFLTSLRAYATASRFDCVVLTPRGAELHLPGVRTIPCMPPGRWRRLRALQKACRDVEAGLLHCPVAGVPIRCPCPTIATVHDLPWLYPELRREPGSRVGQRLAFTLAMKVAAAVIVPSLATRADVARCSNGSDSRVRVIHHGVEAPEGSSAATGQTGPFLILGDDRPRKNLHRVRRAHTTAAARVADLPDLRLVGPGHGYVSDTEKWHILRQSRALLHLSLLEGFGLPVLEAFAHGVPVVCSNTTSLPEVADDAALLVDPRDDARMADAIVRVHQDEALRQELRERGLHRAREMTPEKTAAAWRDLHEELLS